MCRTLLLSLVVAGLALGLPFAREQLAERGGRVAARGAALEEEGVLAVRDAEVHFTLYWPDAEPLGKRPLVIFAADAHAAHPKPLKLFAEAARAAGMAAIYLEPTASPTEAATLLKGVLHRQSAPLGMDGLHLWTWVEGKGLRAPMESPCSQTGRLKAALSWLRDSGGGGQQVLRAFSVTFGPGCALKEAL
jgi:hypothetical protein